MPKVILTGNPYVDQFADFVMPPGNMQPHAWLQTIVRDNGKPYWLAINMLSEFVYWYRPRVELDPADHETLIHSQRFSSKTGMIPRSYSELEERYGASTATIRRALTHLEELGTIERVVMTDTSGRGKSAQVQMYIKVLREGIEAVSHPERELMNKTAEFVKPQVNPPTQIWRDPMSEMTGVPELAIVEKCEDEGSNQTDDCAVSAENAGQSTSGNDKTAGKSTRSNMKGGPFIFERPNIVEIKREPNNYPTPTPPPPDPERYIAECAEERAEERGGDAQERVAGLEDSHEVPSGDSGSASDAFNRAWSLVPSAKQTESSRLTALRAWKRALEKPDVTEALLASGYGEYVADEEAKGTPARYIAALSTWIEPKKPMSGVSLEVLVKQLRKRRERDRREQERYQSEMRRNEEHRALQEAELALRERDERAQELYRLAYDPAASPTPPMRRRDEYRAYRDYVQARIRGDP